MAEGETKWERPQPLPTRDRVITITSGGQDDGSSCSSAAPIGTPSRLSTM